MALGSRIRSTRVKNNLTQKQFGYLFNLSESVISLYESGKRIPSHDIIIKIAQHFNVSIDYLFGLEDEPRKDVFLGRNGHDADTSTIQQTDAALEVLANQKEKREEIVNLILDNEKIPSKHLDLIRNIIYLFVNEKY